MKSLNFWLISVILLMAASIIHAQYNYSDYRFPDVKVQGLDTEFRLNGNGGNPNRQSNQLNNLSLNLTGNYFRFKNSPKIQKTDIIDLYSSFDRNFKRYIPAFYVRNNITTLTKSQIRRDYYKPETTFLGLKGLYREIDHKLRFNLYNIDQPNIFFSSGRNKYNTTTIDFELPLKIGIGRIEPIRELFLAQFLMDDLLKEGIITQKFSQEQLFELGQLMADVSNKRIFDFRRFNIYQLTRLAEWLEAQGVQNDIKSFAIINDNWNYAFNLQRQEGKRLSLGLTPWAISHWSEINLMRNNEHYYGLDINVEYVQIKNKNQYLQREFGFDLSANILYQKNNTADRNPANLGIYYGWTYTPNSRTTASFLPRMDYTYDFKQDVAFNINLPINYNYFINDRMRLLVNFGYQLGLNESGLIYRPMGGQEFNRNFIRPQSTLPSNEILNYIDNGRHWFFNATFRYNLF